MLISIAQLGWLLTAIVPVSAVAAVIGLMLLVALEMGARVVIENRLGWTPWNAGHIAERFGLLTLICLGEVIAATTRAVGVLIEEQGWSLAAVVLMTSGLALAAGLWWAYYLVPSQVVLRRWPERVFAWRYTHLLLFAAIPAVGAGLRLSAEAFEGTELTLMQITLALAIPVACVLLLIFVLWSVLTQSYDVSHIPLLLVSLLPIGIAILLASAAGGSAVFDPHSRSDVTALVSVIALVAGSAVVEVIGHEIVGYPHTLRVVERQLAADASSEGRSQPPTDARQES
jgi:low temperature requirement protein LtrA